MRLIRRILVAIKDPTSKSLPAVAKAAQLAKALGAELELFHSIASPLYIDAYLMNRSTAIERKMRSARITELEKIARPLRARGLKVTVAAAWDYPVYEAIVRRALRMKADLVIAERHAGRHIVPGLLRLTDWELLRLVPVPILLVKTSGLYAHPVVLAAIDPAHTFAKPTNLDAEILEASSVFATALRGTLHAVHAYIPVGAFPHSTATAETVENLELEAATEARDRFDKALAKATVSRRRRHLVARHPIDAIEQTAKATRSALVVMGAISRSGLKRLAIGNTAESVLDHLTCDLLVVKPKNFVGRVQRSGRGARLRVSTGGI